jgi:uncharacterized membrane protein
MYKTSQNSASISILNNNLVLPAILILAAFLRTVFIGNHSFWVDELFTLQYAIANFPDMMQKIVSDGAHPPTYYILLHYWVSLFGDSEASLRTPSAIFSVLSVYFTYKIGELLFDRKVAVIAALLLTLSEYSIYYAQEARMYSLLAFTSVLSVYFLLKLLKQQNLWTVFNYVWSSTLLVYVHVYGLFIIVAQNIYILLSLYIFCDKDVGIHLKKWVLTQGCIILLSLPWLGFVIHRALRMAEEGFWVKTPTLHTVIQSFAALSGTYKGLPVWVLLMLLGIFSVVIIKLPFGRKLLTDKLALHEGRHVFLLSLLLFTPIIIPYVASQFLSPMYTTRGTIAGHFAFYLLVAIGILHLRWRSLRFAALGIVLALSLKQISSQNYVHSKTPQFKEIVDYLAMNMAETDAVVLCDQQHFIWPFKHYAKKQGLTSKITLIRNSQVLPVQLEADRLWLIRRTDRENPCQQLPPAISKNYIKADMKGKSFRHLDLTLLINM